MAQVIAIANQKGGVGKTTTAINLAASLAHLGQETLLIDMDPQSNLSSGLGIVGEKVTKHIYHVLLQDAPLEDILRETCVEWLDVAPSHIDLYGVEVELVNAENREKRLKTALEKFHKAYKYIFIDCPPALNLLTLNALACADSVLIPMQCEYYALEGLSLLVRTIDRMRGALNPRLQLEGVLVTMYDPRTNLVQQVHQEVKKFFGNKLYQTTIPRNIRLAEAPSYGKPVLSYDKNSSGALAYLGLAKEFLGRRGLSVEPHEDSAAEPPASPAEPAANGSSAPGEVSS
ncbi:MAG: ParA family protein [Elusimicrobia bacterium]|nr:ParA family protein [Elusimicrobiota bacterium]